MGAILLAQQRTYAEDVALLAKELRQFLALMEERTSHKQDLEEAVTATVVCLRKLQILATAAASFGGHVGAGDAHSWSSLQQSRLAIFQRKGAIGSAIQILLQYSSPPSSTAR
jgi:hypothetical protein